MYFCIVCCNLSFFISNFVDLIFLSFVLMSLVKGLSILFIFSKNQLLVSLILLLLLSFLFHLFLLGSLWFLSGFFLVSLFFFFPGSFRCKVRLSICLMFFLFLEVGMYCYQLPSGNCFCCIPQVWVVMFSLSFVSGNLWFPFWFLQSSVGCLECIV